MTSLNHYALGAVADWLHRVVGGLEPIEPGYRTMRIAPQPGGGGPRGIAGGMPIDVSGMLKGTDVDGPFTGVVQLAQKLASSPQVAGCAVKQLFRFGFGRYETPEDAPTLTQLAGAFQTNRQKIVDLLVAMTQVPAFMMLEVTQ